VVHCTKGKFVQVIHDDKKVPNVMIAVYEYENGMIIQNEVRNLYTNLEGLEGRGNCFPDLSASFGKQIFMLEYQVIA
jgi:hypothetical protein